jgi:hypothetical protein
VRHAATRLVALVVFAHLATGGCASDKKDLPVRVTSDRAVVRPCIDLARVTTDLEGKGGEADLRQQTADLGGNVLLVYNSRSGGAFYCEKPPPPDVTVPAPHMKPAPR